MRIGVYGSTSNPPHIAHVICAQEAASQLNLDRVFWVVAGDPPHKPVADGVPAHVRLAMTEATTSADPCFETCDLELRRQGPSFMVDTLEQLGDDHPDDELVLIVGGDQALAFAAWREPERILELATLACCEREGSLRDTVREQMAALDGGEGVVFFDVPRLDLSSSEIRARVREGRPVRYLVPDPVVEIIERERLYRADR